VDWKRVEPAIKEKCERGRPLQRPMGKPDRIEKREDEQHQETGVGGGGSRGGDVFSSKGEHKGKKRKHRPYKRKKTSKNLVDLST